MLLFFVFSLIFGHLLDKQEVIFYCVREEPVVFLRKDEDFVPYTPRKKENLHENLHGLNKEEPVESLELTVRKEVSRAELSSRNDDLTRSTLTPLCHSVSQLHDFAALNENVFYVYNDIEFFKDEPQKVHIACEDDIHVSEEVYKRPMFNMPAYRLFTLFPFFLFLLALGCLDALRDPPGCK